MSSVQSDIELLRQTLGEDFDYAPANETATDAIPTDSSADEKAPSLSVLKRQRLGTEASECLSSDSHRASEEDLLERFTTSAPASVERQQDKSPKNRIFLKQAKFASDSAEVFAPKPVVVSGGGVVTERG